VGDLARDPDLVVEPREPRGVARETRRQELQRDRLVQLQVVGAVDFAHTTPAQQADDPVALAHDSSGQEPPMEDVGRRPRGGQPGGGLRGVERGRGRSARSGHDARAARRTETTAGRHLGRALAARRHGAEL
jgi:hypothetical protein